MDYRTSSTSLRMIFSISDLVPTSRMYKFFKSLTFFFYFIMMLFKWLIVLSYVFLSMLAILFTKSWSFDWMLKLMRRESFPSFDYLKPWLVREFSNRLDGCFFNVLTEGSLVWGVWSLAMNDRSSISSCSIYLLTSLRSF